MYKKDLFRFVFGSLVVFLVVGAIGFMCVGSLKREASLAARDTLPGLMNAGAANNLMEDAFLRSLSLADFKTAQEREKYLQQIAEASRQTDRYMEKYQQAIFSEEDRANFDTLKQAQKEYAKTCQQFFQLIQNGDQPAALAFLKSTLVPAYDKYNKAGDVLFDFNVKAGETRIEKMLTLSYATPIIVGLFGVVIFIVGALVGFRTTLP